MLEQIQTLMSTMELSLHEKYSNWSFFYNVNMAHTNGSIHEHVWMKNKVTPVDTCHYRKEKMHLCIRSTHYAYSIIWLNQ